MLSRKAALLGRGGRLTRVVTSRTMCVVANANHPIGLRSAMKRVIHIGAINVVTHPHASSRYQELLKSVHKRRKAARIRADRFGMISLLVPSERPTRASAFAEGLIGTFTKIDASSDWINVSTGLKAEDSDRLVIQKIPTNLQPDFVTHRFRFYLRGHELFFEIGNGGHRLTQGNAESLFKRLFSAGPIVTKYGEVDVTVIPSPDSIEQIMAAREMLSLRLAINKPNPDSGAAAERQFMERLGRIKARRVETTFTAERGSSIKPDEEIVEEAMVAARNGRVDAVIKKMGRRKTVSTADMPFLYSYEYDDKSLPAWEAFAAACDEARGKLDERRS